MDFWRCLVDLDVAGMQKLWGAVAPNQKQHDDKETLIGLHHARTLADSIPFNLRAYSHSWLVERGLPSGLPDELKPRAERIYPRIVEGVGVSVRQMGNVETPLTRAVERAMSDAVSDCYADGKTDPIFVKARMGEAYRKTLRG